MNRPAVTNTEYGLKTVQTDSIIIPKYYNTIVPTVGPDHDKTEYYLAKIDKTVGSYNF